MHRSKGCCISFWQRTQVLTKIPVFPMEKHMLCLPRVFTKLIKPIAASLRKRGIRIIIYLDDFLILGSSIKESKAKTQLTLDLLQWLGFTIIWERSMLVLTQSLTFLGLSIGGFMLTSLFTFLLIYIPLCPQKKTYLVYTDSRQLKS